MSAERLLWVYHRQRCVGRLSDAPLAFTYEPSWLDRLDAFPLSVALPLRRSTYPEAEARAFFANLLPEGDVRALLTRRLGLSLDNDFALLAAIGGECAGALSIVATPDEADHPGSYRSIGESELLRWIAEGAGLGTMAGTDGVRLSLAGAQDKIPVRIDDGQLLLPIGAAPSSHILKLPGSRFKHLPTNEVYTLRLAGAVGLPVVNATLLQIGRRRIAAIERYDRMRNGHVIERLHQEDFCQACGLPPHRKYQIEGGPDARQCTAIVREWSTAPAADVHALIRWLIFNAIVGNADGHAKNLALLHGPSGIRLAPFYDLVCTRAYPRIDRHLAFAIGGQSDPDRLVPASLDALAAELEVGARYLRQTATEIVEAIEAMAHSVLAQLESETGSQTFLRSAVLPTVARGCRRFRQSASTT